MDKLVKSGRLIYATGIASLGILCIISKDFIVGRPPAWPADFVFNPVLAYVTGTILVLAAVAIILKKRAGLAALVIATLIFFLSVLRHLPHFMEDWGNSYKSMALVGGTLIISASFFREEANGSSGKAFSERAMKNFVFIGCIFIAAFFIACGYSHFKFDDFVKTYIPDYIPFRAFWTYFCAICLFAGAAGLIIPQTRRLAALLSGIMIGGWFLFLHIPRFIANTNDPSDRMGLFESFTFVGILFVLAGMLRDKTANRFMTETTSQSNSIPVAHPARNEAV
jgi:uncharacterized membrane protein